MGSPVHGGVFGKRLAVRLRNVEDVDGTEAKNLLAVLVGVGAPCELVLGRPLPEEHRSEDDDALLALA